MAKLPPVKLETHATWFNLLLTLLHEHAETTRMRNTAGWH